MMSACESVCCSMWVSFSFSSSLMIVICIEMISVLLLTYGGRVLNIIELMGKQIIRIEYLTNWNACTNAMETIDCNRSR